MSRFVFALLLGIATFLPTTAKAQFETVIIRNNCWREIQVAINYLGLEGNWITDGWWRLAPGESAQVARTRNNIIYLYGESIGPANSRIYWNGGDLYRSIRGSSNSYGFFESQIRTQGWGTWTENMNCN